MHLRRVYKLGFITGFPREASIGGCSRHRFLSRSKGLFEGSVVQRSGSRVLARV